ncbi:uncharacterized protein LOC131856831 [Cryptomeria japonica]|uniref:uncharacterized protein LOC131856831 n=1 Tax=Cryptomeria japonica TaxID=3369 RepID=UPI0027D9CF46|nr:uncharacterized protein LOC131856831 [Cryptomeria japonica]
MVDSAPSWLKLNFDGTTRSGVAVGAGIIRDSLGNLILAYAGNCDSVSSNMAKALALFWGLKLALDINAKRLIIEGDSKLIIEVAKGVAGISWMINNIIKDIWSMIIWLGEFQIHHIYREVKRKPDFDFLKPPGRVGIATDASSITRNATITHIS